MEKAKIGIFLKDCRYGCGKKKKCNRYDGFSRLALQGTRWRRLEGTELRLEKSRSETAADLLGVRQIYSVQLPHRAGLFIFFRAELL